jgi:hypothetical protein
VQLVVPRNRRIAESAACVKGAMLGRIYRACVIV